MECDAHCRVRMASLIAPDSQRLMSRNCSYSDRLTILNLGCHEECHMSHASVQMHCIKATVLQGNTGSVRARTPGPAPSPCRPGRRGTSCTTSAGAARFSQLPPVANPHTVCTSVSHTIPLHISPDSHKQAVDVCIKPRGPECRKIDSVLTTEVVEDLLRRLAIVD